MDYWDLDEIEASETLLSTPQPLPFYTVQNLLSLVPITLPSFYTLPLESIPTNFFRFTKLLLKMMELNCQKDVIEFARKRLQNLFDLEKGYFDSDELLLLQEHKKAVNEYIAWSRGV